MNKPENFGKTRTRSGGLAAGREFAGPVCSADAFQSIVLTPAGHPDPALAIAASRSGAIGVFNAESGADRDVLDAALSRLARHGRASFGAKLAGDPAPEMLDAALAHSNSGLGWLIVDRVAMLASAAKLAAFRAGGGKVICEIFAWTRSCDDLDERVDGWIAKGHESGGLVGEASSFVLLQELAGRTSRLIFVRGGISETTAAASWVAGASGVVIDDQALLLTDCPLAPTLERQLANLSGTETTLIEAPAGGQYLRLMALPGKSAEALRQDVAKAGGLSAEIMARVSWDDGALAPIGQAMVSAGRWAREHRTLGRALRAIGDAVATLPGEASDQGVLGENTPLARDNGTRWPMVQGPMTRVSDRAGFLQCVAEAGALPMAALALMRESEADALLGETRALLGERSWGVGLLGFADADIRAGQMAAIARHRPAFAVIAGGRAQQALDLEADGIATYLHTPTAPLLIDALEQGVRRFVVEGSECGGHIGPLSSFVLWSVAVEKLGAHPIVRREGENVHLLLAGGIHDAPSAAAAATVAAPLAGLGVRIGALAGTGYLFTDEIAESGAVVGEYQRVALECDGTVSLREGGGYTSRCASTAIADEFRDRKRRLETDGADSQSVRRQMERFSLGRLRLATKGVSRGESGGDLRPTSPTEQRACGMYMMGQVAALKSRVSSIEAFHEGLFGAGAAVLRTAAAGIAEHREGSSGTTPARPADIAIVGLSCLLPGAQTIADYWRNILAGRSAITPIPPERWDPETFFDADPETPNRIYSKWGGFLADVALDPLRYGIPPASLDAIDPMQLLALKVVEDALDDAGYSTGGNRDWERTSVILGFSGGLGERGVKYAARSELARIGAGAASQDDTLARLPEWTEDSFAGLLPNVAAGRAANRLNLGGLNATVDAACASSLAAVYQAVMELETGRSDMVVAGGIDCTQSPFGYLCFAKTHALSPRGECRTFDRSADGIVISEGLAALVLKRLDTAERDGDRIYGVIKGVGASSDGRAKGLTAPLPAGQRRALRRAYQQAGYTPSSVDLFEAHGTGTVAGDRAELETVTSVLREAGAARKSAAIGSVKSLIGHTKATAGIAGLIKATLGLHHRTLPPHAGVEEPNPALADAASPLYLSQTPRPWVRHPGHPRRAGVSAFGFGGTNFHVTIEEYAGNFRPWLGGAPQSWPCELFVWRGRNRADLRKSIEATAAQIHAGGDDLAAIARATVDRLARGPATLALTAETGDELATLIGRAINWLGGDEPSPPAHIAYADAPLLDGNRLAVLFSGQGAQYPDMLRDVALFFPAMAGVLDEANRALADTPTFSGDATPPLSRIIFPGDTFGAEERRRAMTELTRTEVTQPALGAIGAGLWTVLSDLGLRADMCGGHSYGEYVALNAAGVLGFDDLMRLSEQRGRAIAESGDPANPGAMAAVRAAPDQVRAMLEQCPDVVLANLNSPRQSVIAGPKGAVDDAVQRLRDNDLVVQRVPVSQAFHSPEMNGAREAFERHLMACSWSAPECDVYSNTLAAPHGQSPEDIRSVMADHLVSPVDFQGMVEAMYENGARVFLELGPKAILAARTAEILGERRHRALAVDATGGLRSFLDAIAGLVVEGCELDLASLFAGRELSGRSANNEIASTQTGWLVDPGGVRPAHSTRPGPAKNAKAPPTAIPDGRASGQQIVDQSRSTAMKHDDHRSPPAPALDPAMEAYHRTMREFLRVQESVMMAMLRSEPAMPFAEVEYLQDMPVVDAQDAALAPVSAPPPAPEPVEVAPVAPIVVSEPIAEAPVANGSAVAAARAENSEQPPDIAETLVAIVADKTGYPSDALGLDQNLEADLGIDSIKKMEILGSLRKALPEPQAARMKKNMDTVAELPSLRAIADFLGDHGTPPNGTAVEGDPRPFELTGQGNGARSVLARYVPVAHREPLDDGPLDELEAGIYVVTRDPIGVSGHLIAHLVRSGVTPVLLEPEILADEDRLAGQLADWKQNGEGIRAVIHLAAMAATPDDFAGMSLTDWRDGMARGAKDIFRLLRQCADDLADGGCFIAATAMGGGFGREAGGSPESGRLTMSFGAGCNGLVKALSLEWPDCRAKIVDLDPAEPVGHLAEHVLG